MRGAPHAHICAFLHPDDKLKQDIDKIDQMIWAEIPIDYNSGEFQTYLKKYRNVDINRTHRWKQRENDVSDVDDEVTFLFQES